MLSSNGKYGFVRTYFFSKGVESPGRILFLKSWELKVLGEISFFKGKSYFFSKGVESYFLKGNPFLKSGAQGRLEIPQRLTSWKHALYVCYSSFVCSSLVGNQKRTTKAMLFYGPISKNGCLKGFLLRLPNKAFRRKEQRRLGNKCRWALVCHPGKLSFSYPFFKGCLKLFKGVLSLFKVFFLRIFCPF